MDFSATPIQQQLIVRHLGIAEYVPVWEAMQAFTDKRDETVADELWLLQHPPVFTQGQAGKAEHLLNPGDIPVIQVDRGGQVTYHGPGQLVAYVMIDLTRRKLGVRELVTAIENSIVKVLERFGIAASPRKEAPGVYIDKPQSSPQFMTLGQDGAQDLGAKIAQLGLRVRRGCSFHGLSLNMDMDMEPFLRINPCGHVGMEVTSIALQRGEPLSVEALSAALLAELSAELSYTALQQINDGLLPGTTLAVSR